MDNDSSRALQYDTSVRDRSTPVVSMENVSHYFSTGALRTQVLFGVTADILPGELVIVMGPSGSGKTTMLNLIGGLRRRHGGPVASFSGKSSRPEQNRRSAACEAGSVSSFSTITCSFR